MFIKLLNRSIKGLTLIETLIVVSIISLLAAIAVTMFMDYRVNSAKRVLLSDTKNCLNVCLAKLTDNQQNCFASDCSISDFTSSCTPDFNGPIYMRCDGKGVLSGYSCSVYQDGQVSCS